MLAVSAWHLRKGKRGRRRSIGPPRSRWSCCCRAILLQMFVGSQLGVIEAKYQPMKIAAAEAQWETCQPCSFSAFQVGGGKDDETPTKVIAIPHLLSVLATGTWNGEVVGPQRAAGAVPGSKYGPGNYVPNVFIQYWSMRVMAYLGSLIAAVRAVGRLAAAQGQARLARSGSCGSRCGRWCTPFLMNTAGWMLTENGRQPWIVQGLMKTDQRDLAVGQRDRDLDQPDRVRADLHRARARPTWC